MTTMQQPAKGTKAVSSGKHWPMVIVGMLGLNVCVCATTVFFATRDGPVAVEPDYYQRAVDWDSTRAALPAPASRGWTVEANAGANGIELWLSDGAQTDLTGAEVRATAFHRAFADERHQLRLTEREPGLYAAELPNQLAGLWEVRVEIRRDGVGAASILTLDRQVR